ncbi:hypothetical protein A2U01_0075809, partial [Trifolium medium]|nr:hypothetical protein [Trifolium medium]
VLARHAGKASGSRFWFWALRNAQPWMARRAVLHAGVVVATVVCAARREAGAARGRDAYL